MHAISKTYTTLLVTYGSGHQNILPLLALLALDVVAFTITVALTIQLLTATATVRPTATTALEPVSHFIKGRPESWMRDTRDYQVLEPIVEIMNGEKQEYKNIAVLFRIYLNLHSYIFALLQVNRM